jgi:hypothetical protein
MPKKIVIVIIVILAILIIGAVIFLLPIFQSVPKAVLEVGKGTVEINTGSGWNKAGSGTELKQDWQIRTGSDGEANIIFFGNSVVRMANDSEVNIKELKLVEKTLWVRLEQSKGDVWHSISPVSGISKYIVDTPFGSFTEIGTSFGISIDKKKVAVLNGLVVRTGQEQTVISGGMQAKILEGEPTKIVALEEDSWVLQNKKAEEDWLVKRREEIKRKYRNQISIAVSLGPKVLKKEITDDMINDAIDRYLRGEIDVEKLIEEGKIPQEFVALIPDEFRRHPKFALTLASTPTITETSMPTPTPTPTITETPTPVPTPTPTPEPVVVATPTGKIVYTKIYGSSLSDTVLKINAGDTVEWNNEDDITYTLVEKDNKRSNITIKDGKRVRNTFNQTGDYHFSLIYSGLRTTPKQQNISVRVNASNATQ